jgi:hypothetical protein
MCADRLTDEALPLWVTAALQEPLLWQTMALCWMQAAATFERRADKCPASLHCCCSVCSLTLAPLRVVVQDAC